MLGANQEYSESHMYKASISKKFALNNFVLDNTLQYQKVIEEDLGVINIPEIILRNTFYYPK